MAKPGCVPPKPVLALPPAPFASVIVTAGLMTLPGWFHVMVRPVCTLTMCVLQVSWVSGQACLQLSMCDLQVSWVSGQACVQLSVCVSR